MSHRITPPDGADWTIEAVPSAQGVNLVISLPELAQARITLVIEQGEARAFARAILAAAGDGIERTFVEGLVRTEAGKKAAGRLLDGVEHNGMPEGRT